jgi:YVTN family beta-propeller protein
MTGSCRRIVLSMAGAVLLLFLVPALPAEAATGSAGRPCRPKPSQASLYVGNAFSDSVGVIGVRSGALRTTIPVTSPTALAVTGDRSLVFVASSAGVFEPGHVVAISTATNTALPPVRVGIDPRALAVSPDNRTLYVGNAGSGTVQFIDIATMTVRQSVDVGAGSFPGALAITPDGRTLVVARRDRRDVVRIDTGSGSLVGTPVLLPDTGGVGPQSMAMSRDGSQVFVDNNTAVAVVDVASGAVAGSIPLDLVPWQEPPPGLPAIPVWDQHFGMALSPDGRYLAVTDFFGKAVQLLDTVTGTGAPPIVIPGIVHALGVAFVGPRTIAVVVRLPEGDAGAVVMVDVATAQIRPLIPTGGTGPVAIAVVAPCRRA